MMAPDCSPSTWEVEAEGSTVQGQPGLRLAEKKYKKLQLKMGSYKLGCVAQMIWTQCHVIPYVQHSQFSLLKYSTELFCALGTAWLCSLPRVHREAGRKHSENTVLTFCPGSVYQPCDHVRTPGLHESSFVIYKFGRLIHTLVKLSFTQQKEGGNRFLTYCLAPQQSGLC